MDPLSTKSSVSSQRVIIVGSIFALLLAGVIIWTYTIYNKGYFASLSSIKENETRKIEKLKLVVFDAESKPYSGFSSLNIAKPPVALGKNDCMLPNKIVDSQLTIDMNAILSSLQKEPPPSSNENCQNSYRLVLLRRIPEFLSIIINKPTEVKEWLQLNSEFAQLLNSEIGKNLFYEFKDIANLQSNNLNLSSLKDSFLVELFYDTLQADAKIYGDFSHGIGGWIYSFNPKKAKLSTTSLISFLNIIVDKGYSIPTLKSPLWRFSFAGRTIFIGEHQDRIYIGFDLSGLINAIDNEGSMQAIPKDDSVTLSINPTAYLSHRFVAVLNEKSAFTTHMGFNLSKSTMEISKVSTSSSKIYNSLSPSLSEGIANAISADVFFSLALSYTPTETLKEDFWKNFDNPNSTFPPSKSKTGGIAIIWDIISEGNSKNISDIAYVFSDDAANPLDFKKSVLDFLSPNTNIRYCPTTKTWIGSSSQNLLAKLMNTCNINAPAVSSLVANKNLITQNQAMLFLNFPSAIREAFLAGGITKKQDHKNIIETEMETSLHQAKLKLWSAIEVELSRFPKTLLFGTIDKNRELHLQRMQ